MFLEQISILKWFLKDHVTLKTGVIMRKGVTGVNYILNILKQKRVILDYGNISRYCIFDQINAALVSIRELIKKY